MVRILTLALMVFLTLFLIVMGTFVAVTIIADEIKERKSRRT